MVWAVFKSAKRDTAILWFHKLELI